LWHHWCEQRYQEATFAANAFGLPASYLSIFKCKKDERRDRKMQAFAWKKDAVKRDKNILPAIVCCVQHRMTEHRTSSSSANPNTFAYGIEDVSSVTSGCEAAMICIVVAESIGAPVRKGRKVKKGRQKKAKDKKHLEGENGTKGRNTRDA
jgi:hypothetical protein